MFEKYILEERRAKYVRNNDILNDYWSFLCGEVENREHQMADYCLLMKILWKIPFKSFNPMDDNRIEDALDMRNEYLRDISRYRIDTSVVEDRYVSCLEVLISLAKRMENDILCDPMEEIDHSADHFWTFLRNLDVEKYSNDRISEAEINEKVTKWVRREYQKDGFGSIFPIRRPKNDMRKLEIWDQMSCYVMENY